MDAPRFPGSDERAPVFNERAVAESQALERKAVRVQFALLNELNLQQTTLERVVRGYWAAQERLEICLDVANWLNGGKTRPERLEDPDFWRRLDELIGDIDPLGRAVSGLDLGADFTTSGETFDAEYATVTRLVRNMRRPGQEGEARTVADDMLMSVYEMSDACRYIRRTCRDEADDVISQIKQRLDKILIRIEVEEERAAAPAVQTSTPDAAALRGVESASASAQDVGRSPLRPPVERQEYTQALAHTENDHEHEGRQ